MFTFVLKIFGLVFAILILLTFKDVVSLLFPKK